MANDKIYQNYLMHYRTKGSRNGYTKDPNYTPVGKRAKIEYKSPVDEGGFFEFMGKDIADRFKKRFKSFAKDRRRDLQERVNNLKKDLTTETYLAKHNPNGLSDYVAEKARTPEGKKKYAKAIMDYVMPTDRKRMAANEDDFFDFMRHDIVDRRNEKLNSVKKKLKNKIANVIGSKSGSRIINRVTNRLVRRGAQKVAKLLNE